MTDLPPDSDLVSEVHNILRTNDLEKTTLRIVMTLLSQRLSIPADQLATKKPFIRVTISEYLENAYHSQAQEEEDAAEEESPAPAPARKKRKASDGSAKPVKLTGLQRAVVLAEPLADFLGAPVICRSHIQKRVIEYAKEKDLQDPSDRRIVICDEPLKKALSVSKFTFFQLAKLISELVYKPDECNDELQKLAKECEEKALQEKINKLQEMEANGETKPTKASRKKQKRAKGDPDNKKKMSGLMRPMQLSEALIAVVGETQLPRPEVLKKIWEYIRANQLKDPNNGTRILCDQKLQAVFDGSETVTNMGINKYLSAHMTRIP